jgi:uncharacterized protein YcbK (DUF882 family)
MKLTQNFSKIEFESRDGAPMPDDVLENIKILAQNLQTLRDHFGQAIHINSAYRSPEHNKNIGGATSSQHLLGKAADISMRNFTPVQIHETIEQLIAEGDLHQGGLGLYNGFVHYDIRGTKARWDFRE